jgi:hypothetical protein
MEYGISNPIAIRPPLSCAWWIPWQMLIPVEYRAWEIHGQVDVMASWPFWQSRILVYPQYLFPMRTQRNTTAWCRKSEVYGSLWDSINICQILTGSSLVEMICLSSCLTTWKPIDSFLNTLTASVRVQNVLYSTCIQTQCTVEEGKSHEISNHITRHSTVNMGQIRSIQVKMVDGFGYKVMKVSVQRSES